MYLPRPYGSLLLGYFRYEKLAHRVYAFLYPGMTPFRSLGLQFRYRMDRTSSLFFERGSAFAHRVGLSAQEVGTVRLPSNSHGTQTGLSPGGAEASEWWPRNTTVLPLAPRRSGRILGIEHRKVVFSVVSALIQERVACHDPGGYQRR